MSQPNPPAAIQPQPPALAAMNGSAPKPQMAPDEIEADAPLFGDGLGLDSIDVLEIALVISKQYGFQLKSDHEDNVRIFSSLRALTTHIASQRSK